MGAYYVTLYIHLKDVSQIFVCQIIMPNCCAMKHIFNCFVNIKLKLVNLYNVVMALRR